MDYERENDSALSNMRTGWEKRAQAMVKLIPKNVGSILDIGCGECLLKKYLPREIKYYGLDYRKRNDETIVCNINEEKIPVINGIDNSDVFHDFKSYIIRVCHKSSFRLFSNKYLSFPGCAHRPELIK